MLLFGLGSTTFAAEPVLREDRPDRYVVVPGDTLWGIAGRFLKDPWRWPELMKLNRDQIKNPHRIYPGDVLALDASGTRLSVVDSQTVRMGPRVRIEGREGGKEIPSISPSAIEPFLSQPLVLDQAALDGAARIVAAQENRVVLGAGNIAYAKGVPSSATEFWQVFRAGGPLVDPESKEALGYEAIYLGEARLTRPGDVSTLEIVKSAQEILIGDRIFPAPKAQFASYAPHAPEKQVTGRIIAAYNSLSEVGASSIVTLNRGTREGIEVGHVLALYRSQDASRDVMRNQPLYGRQGLIQLEAGSKAVSEPISDLRNSPIYGRQGPTGNDPSIKGTELAPNLPDERYGLVFVFRTFEKVSYALVMQADRPVQVFDAVRNP